MWTKQRKIGEGEERGEEVWNKSLLIKKGECVNQKEKKLEVGGRGGGGNREEKESRRGGEKKTETRW